MILETGLMREEILKILLFFFETTNRLLAELDIALKKHDYQQIQNIAHKIKGSSGNLRLEFIYKIVKALEVASKNKDIEQCETLTEELNYHLNKYDDFV